MTRSNRARLVGLVTSAVLLATGGVHAAWAMGATWPRQSREELADLVVGRRPFPTAPQTVAVTGLLVSASALVAVAGGIIPAGHRRFRSLARLGSRVVAGTLAVRGLGGLLVSSTAMIEATDEFRTHDLWVYSPLCLALAAGALHSTTSDEV